MQKKLNHIPKANLPAGCVKRRISVIFIFFSNNLMHHDQCFSHGQHLSIWLCHDENQKHKITHEEQQNHKGTARSVF